MYPEKAYWTLTNQLLAMIADALRWLQWARTEDGSKNRNAPEPISRPGVTPSRRLVHPRAKGLPRSQVRKLLGRNTEDRNKRIRQLFSKGTYED